MDLTERDRRILFQFVTEKHQNVSNSKPDWIIDFMDLSNPELIVFLNNKVVLAQAGIASLDANRIQAEQAFLRDIQDLQALSVKLEQPGKPQ